MSRRVAALTALVLLAVVLGAAQLLNGPRGGRDAGTRFTPTPPAVRLAPGQVVELHAALHDLDASCAGRDSPSRRQAVARDTAVVVAFAERYPNAVFPIDDETGRTLSLLLVVRQTLRRCAPGLVGRIDRLLPSDLRSTPTPRSTRS